MDSTSGTTSARLTLLGVLLACGTVSALALDSQRVPHALKSVRDTVGLSGALPRGSESLGATQRNAHEGELKEPIATVLKHPKAFLKRFGQHGWAGNVVPRECTGCTGTQLTTVSIGAIEDAHTVDFKKLPAHGVIMARLENHGEWTEARYGIPPHAVWFMLWGGDPSASRPAARFVKVVHKYGMTSLALDAKSYPIDSCAHNADTTNEKKPDADFKTCELRALSTVRADAWISCSQGCCTAGNDTSLTSRSRSRP